MLRYDYALFDLDGTLTESGPGIINSVKYSLNAFGIHEEDDDNLRKFIGPPLIDAFRDYYGFNQKDAQTATNLYREYYKTQGIFENSLYCGIRDMLTTLSNAGVSLMVATSKPEHFCMQILDHFDISQYFSFVSAALVNEGRTKKDEVIAHLLDSCCINDQSRIVMVGDRQYDILGAASFGLDSIGVTYGYGSSEELRAAGATHLADAPENIVSIILGNS